MVGQLHAVHRARHADVGHQELDLWMGVEQDNRLVHVSGRKHDQAHGREASDKFDADHRLVLDDQYSRLFLGCGPGHAALTRIKTVGSICSVGDVQDGVNGLAVQALRQKPYPWFSRAVPGLTGSLLGRSGRPPGTH